MAIRHLVLRSTDLSSAPARRKRRLTRPAAVGETPALPGLLLDDVFGLEVQIFQDLLLHLINGCPRICLYKYLLFVELAQSDFGRLAIFVHNLELSRRTCESILGICEVRVVDEFFALQIFQRPKNLVFADEFTLVPGGFAHLPLVVASAEEGELLVGEF